MENRKIKPLTMKEKMTVQLFLGCGLAIVGVILIFTSFFVPPLGIIHSSVLAAIGEIFTFAGALIGIDYSYKFKEVKYINDYNKQIEDGEQE